ncbi:MAG: histidine kinase [Cytophagales bacterium]|nr:histidine kinase [Cytophagales bacterium]
MKLKLTEPIIRWVGIPIVAYIANQVMAHLEDRPAGIVYLISLGFTALYWNGACYIIFYFRRRFPEINRTKKRLIHTAIFIMIWMSIGGIPLKLLVGVKEFQDILQPSEHTQFLPFNFVAAIIITLGYEAAYFFDKWQVTFRQNEELKNQQIRTQFEVLQNQMSPHFLFNSLNALTTLIAENQDTAIEFTQKLSEVYRYILQTKDKELVRLSEEIEFSKAYLFLLQMRYPENLATEFSIEHQYMDQYVAPLTIQMLIENAIKHNVISKTHPLKIEIYVENGLSVVVKNNLQIKKTIEKSTKTGLANIKKRYQFLGNREIDIITTAHNYMVAIPLINVMREEDYKLASA